jgi:hypothetical protein
VSELLVSPHNGRRRSFTPPDGRLRRSQEIVFLGLFENVLSLILVRTVDISTQYSGFHALRKSYGCSGQLMANPDF